MPKKFRIKYSLGEDFEEAIRKKVAQHVRESIDRQARELSMSMFADGDAARRAAEDRKRVLRDVLRMAFPDMTAAAEIVMTEDNPITFLGERVFIPHHTIIDVDAGRIFDFDAVHLMLAGSEYVYLLVTEMEGGAVSVTITAIQEDANAPPQIDAGSADATTGDQT